MSKKPNVYRCIGGCDTLVTGPDQLCLACAAQTCQCAKPKVALVTDETFDGLFVDMPVAASEWSFCDRCSLTLGPR